MYKLPVKLHFLNMSYDLKDFSSVNFDLHWFLAPEPLRKTKHKFGKLAKF